MASAVLAPSAEPATRPCLYWRTLRNGSQANISHTRKAISANHAGASTSCAVNVSWNA